jgi:hypothetical protein
VSKGSPEDRDDLQELLERGRRARENMQAIIDRIDARREEERQRRERRRQLIRRVFLPFRRAA